MPEPNQNSVGLLTTVTSEFHWPHAMTFLKRLEELVGTGNVIQITTWLAPQIVGTLTCDNVEVSVLDLVLRVFAVLEGEVELLGLAQPLNLLVLLREADVGVGVLRRIQWSSLFDLGSDLNHTFTNM